MGSYRISVPMVGGGSTRAPGDTTPPVESYDLGPKIKAAIACGVFAWLFLSVAWSAFFFAPWQRWAKGMGVIAGIGVLVACGLGFWWSFQAAYRAWNVDNKERGRRYKLEDVHRKAQEAAVKAAENQVKYGDDTDNNPSTFTNEQRLDFVAIRMLERAYLGKGSPTRDVMCGDGICLQAEWNLVNAGMKAIGVRDKKTWAALGFQGAWELWREGVKLETDGDGDCYLMVLKQNGNWHAIERVE